MYDKSTTGRDNSWWTRERQTSQADGTNVIAVQVSSKSSLATYIDRVCLVGKEMKELGGK
jgi:hypothetical protein